MRKIEVFEMKKAPGRDHYNGTHIGNFNGLRVVFGPHYFVEIYRTKGGKVDFILGATHHGFKVDASDVNSDLDKLIEEIRRLHPTNTVD